MKDMEIEKLDLHGIRHEDARNKVIRFIEKFWNEEKELEIITGHSIKMKGIVLNILYEYDIPYNIGRMHDSNDPRIITWV